MFEQNISQTLNNQARNTSINVSIHHQSHNPGYIFTSRHTNSNSVQCCPQKQRFKITQPNERLTIHINFESKDMSV